jgi:hypothetical protein
LRLWLPCRAEYGSHILIADSALLLEGMIKRVPEGHEAGRQDTGIPKMAVNHHILLCFLKAWLRDFKQARTMPHLFHYFRLYPSSLYSTLTIMA